MQDDFWKALIDLQTSVEPGIIRSVEPLTFSNPMPFPLPAFKSSVLSPKAAVSVPTLENESELLGSPSKYNENIL